MPYGFVSSYPRTVSYRDCFLFPSAGYRHNSSGALTNIGSEGNCWSFVPSGSSSVRLGYNGSNVCFNANNRTNGFSLRCVRAFIGLFRSGFFPTAGTRHRDTGALAYIGSEGYCWSSVSSGSGGVRLGYIGTDVCFIVFHRSNGFSLRCVRVFTGVVAKRFFPAAGYRHNGSGALSNVGSGGYVWSSCVSRYDAGYLNFNGPNVYLQFNSRGYGLSLRCVREITGLFREVFRLQGTVLTRREHCRATVPAGTYGRPVFRVSLRAV